MIAADAVRDLAAREGLDLAHSTAYSDSHTDLPFLEGHVEQGRLAVQPVGVDVPLAAELGDRLEGQFAIALWDRAESSKM